MIDVLYAHWRETCRVLVDYSAFWESQRKPGKAVIKRPKIG